MADTLRATRSVPGFHRADLHLVEINDTLRACSRRRGRLQPAWHERFDEVPAGPMLLVATILDARPCAIREDAARLAERMVGVAQDSGRTRDAGLRARARRHALRFLAARGRRRRQAEIARPGRELASAIGGRVRRDGGWAFDRRLRATTAATGRRCRRSRHRGAGIPIIRRGRPQCPCRLRRTCSASGARSLDRPAKAIFCAASESSSVQKPPRRRATTAQRQAVDAALHLIGADQMGTLFRVLAVGRRQKRRADRVFGRSMIKANTLADLSGVQHRSSLAGASAPGSIRR